MVTGFYLTMGAPSRLSTSLCVLHSVFDKSAWLREREITEAWPVAGLPEILHVDNDADFSLPAVASRPPPGLLPEERLAADCYTTPWDVIAGSASVPNFPCRRPVIRGHAPRRRQQKSSAAGPIGDSPATIIESPLCAEIGRAQSLFLLSPPSCLARVSHNTDKVRIVTATVRWAADINATVPQKALSAFECECGA